MMKYSLLYLRMLNWVIFMVESEVERPVRMSATCDIVWVRKVQGLVGYNDSDN